MNYKKKIVKLEKRIRKLEKKIAALEESAQGQQIHFDDLKNSKMIVGANI